MEKFVSSTGRPSKVNQGGALLLAHYKLLWRWQRCPQKRREKTESVTAYFGVHFRRDQCLFNPTQYLLTPAVGAGIRSRGQEDVQQGASGSRVPGPVVAEEGGRAEVRRRDHRGVRCTGGVGGRCLGSPGVERLWRSEVTLAGAIPDSLVPSPASSPASTNPKCFFLFFVPKR